MSNCNFEYSNLTKQRKAYIDAILEHGEQIGLDLSKDTYCRAELRRVSMSLKGKKWIPNWITHDHNRRAGVGVFHLPEVQEAYLASQQRQDDPLGDVDIVSENEKQRRQIRERLEAEIDACVPEEISW